MVCDTDIYRFLESLKYRPETYKTILGQEYNNRSTATNLIRKKISKFVNAGWVMAGLLDGEGGTKIFFSPFKEYIIWIVRSNIPNKRFEYYYCSNTYAGDIPGKALLFNAFILGEFDWISLGNISMSEADLVRCF